MTLLTTTLPLALWLTGAAADKPAQMACAPAGALSAVLKERYDETRVFTGVASNGVGVLYLFMSPEGSWTLLARGPENSMCMVSEGKQADIRMPGT